MKIIICFIIAGLLVPLAHSSQLRILHTNDLHGQILGTTTTPLIGGYAELKAIMDKITDDSKKQGIPVLRLDAGDFSEGSLAYKARDGLGIFELMEMMEYDAIALGNHDYLMGAQKLDQILGQTSLPLVASNLEIKNEFIHLREAVAPYRKIRKGDVDIAIIGGTNGDIFYKWVLNDDVKFLNANRSINKIAKKIKQNSVLTIALTHMGLHGDKLLARKSSEIDLIIGGHNHIQLDNPIIIQNKRKKNVPIFQMGDSGKYLGEILIEINYEKDGRIDCKLISYKIHSIPHSSEEDPIILNKVNEILSDLDEHYGHNYLHESLGFSSIPMENLKHEPTFWTTFFTDAIRESIKAEIAINNNSFFGPSQSAGNITREKIMNFFPHFFDFDQKFGWTIFKATVSGKLIKSLVDLSFEVGYPFLVSGMTFDVRVDQNGKKHAYNFLINGKAIKHVKLYSLALPEGYYQGLIHSSPIMAKLLLKDAIDTKISIWRAVEDKIKRETLPR
jgi:5'-nucleotidase